ncbi:MAG: polymorphic toxin-type HINT domain-containing protein [Pirellula sp.]
MTVRNEFGLSEFVEGTLIHPIWSVDHNDWVSISDLEPGERLQGAEGILYVESIDLVRRNVSVYNIEVHGEHVYQVGELGLLVHNPNECFRVMDAAEFAGAKLGKWADNVNDLDWAGYKWVWDNVDDANSWLRFLKNSGEHGGIITKIDTLQDVSKYQSFLHPPQGIARVVPLNELGRAVRIFQ